MGLANGRDIRSTTFLGADRCFSRHMQTRYSTESNLTKIVGHFPKKSPLVTVKSRVSEKQIQYIMLDGCPIPDLFFFFAL